jgi:sulfur carrier protein ThiS
MSNARMQVTFKLFATLGDYLPPEARYNQVTLTLAEGTRVAEVIDRHSLPPKLVHLVLVNGHFLPPPERVVRELKDGDVLAIWPPIAGG